MRFVPLFATLTVFTGACSAHSPQPAAPAPAPSVSSESVVVPAQLPQTPASASAASPPASAEAVVPAPALPDPEPRSCVFTSARWPGGKVRLRFDANSSAFAEVTAGRASRVELPIGPASVGAAVEIDAWGVQLQGNVPALDTPLHPRAAFVVAGCVVPAGAATLVWMEGKAGAARFSVKPESRVRSLIGALEAERPCTDLHMNAGAFDPGAVLGKPLEGQDLLLRGRRKVAIALTPGGKAAVEIDLSRDRDTEVDALELQGNFARVSWRGDESVVFGWVPRTALAKPGAAIGEAFGTGGLGLSGTGAGSLLKCPHDVPLFASVGGARRPVGRVKAGTGIDRVRTRGDHVAVEFPNSTVTPIAPAEFLVEAVQLTNCK